MTSQREFVAAIVELLVRCDIDYMLTGSIVASFYGRPRATNDADFVIACRREQLPALLTAVDERGWYASATAGAAAIEDRSMFNVIDPASGWKAHLIVKKDRPFSDEEFARRSAAPVFGPDAPALSAATPEDAILSKLEWAHMSDSDRQFDDAIGVAAAQWATLDHAYLTRWATELGVEEPFRRLRVAASRSSA